MEARGAPGQQLSLAARVRRRGQVQLAARRKKLGFIEPTLLEMAAALASSSCWRSAFTIAPDLATSASFAVFSPSSCCSISLAQLRSASSAACSPPRCLLPQQLSLQPCQPPSAPHRPAISGYHGRGRGGGGRGPVRWRAPVRG